MPPDVPPEVRAAIDAVARDRAAQDPDTPSGVHRLAVIAEVRAGIDALAREAGAQARAQGATWAQLAEVLGYRSAAGAQTFLDPSVREAAAARDATRDRGTYRPPARPDLPGIGVAEAARRLGVTRRTIYNRVERGELRAVESHGRTRVVGGDPRLGLDPADSGGPAD